MPVYCSAKSATLCNQWTVYSAHGHKSGFPEAHKAQLDTVQSTIEVYEMQCVSVNRAKFAGESQKSM